MNKTTNPDGKIHRHPEGGYYIQCATLLDDKPAVVTFRIHKGANGGSQTPYWVTEATIRLVLEGGTELPVYATPHGSRVVKNGFTKRQAAEVYHQVREGYVTRGEAAYRARFAPDAVEPVQADDDSQPVSITITREQARDVLAALNRRAYELESLGGPEAAVAAASSRAAYQSIDSQVHPVS